MVGACLVAVSAVAWSAPNALGRNGLAFEANRGQTDASVRFLARGAGHTLFLSPTRAVLSLRSAAGKQKSAALHMRLVGADPGAKMAGSGVLPGKVNYYRGNDPAEWRTNVPTYSRVQCSSVYPGIDIVYYGVVQPAGPPRLEYDFVVRPGADPHRIRLAFEGATKLRVARGGDLVAATPAGDVVWKRPVAYQTVGSRRVPVEVAYDVSGKTAAFRLAQYDANRPLVVDPILQYGTLVGGSANDYVRGVAVDAAGYAYLTGYCMSADFPTTGAAYQPTYAGGGDDVFVTKLSPDGATVAYSTYLGGSGLDEAYGIVVDGSGSAFITGVTTSPNYPTTAGALQRSYNAGWDVFVTKLGATGAALAYSTYIGTSSDDYAWAIAVDTAGCAYVVGDTASAAFPTTAGSVQQAYAGGVDAFVAKLNATGTGLVYATYLGGGAAYDKAMGIVVTADGSAYVAGRTSSPTFPTTLGALKRDLTGASNIFVAKIAPGGQSLLYSTLIGGSSTPFGDSTGVHTLAVDAAGCAYVAGATDSTDYPTTPGALRTTKQGMEGVLSKLSADGSSLVYSTFIGGNDYDTVEGLAVDESGQAHMTGFTASTDFPTTADALDRTYHGQWDAYYTVVSPSGDAVVYSTYFGGARNDAGYQVALGPAQSCYVAGWTGSTTFPTTPGAFRTAPAGADDGFTLKFGSPVTSTSLSVPDRIGTKFASVALKATLTRADTASALPDKSVSFTVDGTAAGSATTDAAGLAQVDYTIPEGPASRTIGAAFAGDGTYASCSGTGTLVVRTATTMVVSDATGRVGNTVALAATLTAGASGLSGKAVRFSVAGSDLSPDANTDAAGKATFGYVIPAGSVGSRALGAAFAGDTGYAAASATATLTVTKARTYVWVSSPTVTVGSEALLVAYLYNHLMNGDLTGVAGASLAFSVSGTAIGSATTASDGKARMTHVPPAWGPLPIGVAFAGDADYEAGSGSGTLTVNAIATGVIVQDASGLTGNAVALKATLKRSSGGAAVPGKTLAFLVDGTGAGSATTDAAGLAGASWTIPAGAASRTIRAEFAGDTVYGSSFGTATLTVLDPVATSVYVPDRTGTITDPVVLKGYLYRASDKVYVAAKGLSFSVAGTAVGSATTDAGGQAQLTWTITAGDASRTIQADFAGDAGYLASTGYGMLSAQATHTKVYVVDRLNVKVKTYTVLKAYLYTTANAIIPGKTLTMSVDGSALGSQATNSSGYISFGYTVPEGSGAGNRVIGASWVGNAGYTASSNTGKLGVVQGNLYIWPYVRSAGRGRTLPLKAYVRSLPDYVIQPGKSIAFSVNGTGVGSADVAADGWASVGWFVPWSEPLGSHTAAAAFAGDSWYAAVLANTTFNVVP
jgi:hypothetical protein